MNDEGARAAAPARHRLRLPGLPVLPHLTVAQNVGPALAAAAGCPTTPAWRALLDDVGWPASANATPQTLLRRPAAARGDRTGAGARAQAAARRRGHRQPRPGNAERVMDTLALQTRCAHGAACLLVTHSRSGRAADRATALVLQRGLCHGSLQPRLACSFRRRLRVRRRTGQIPPRCSPMPLCGIPSSNPTRVDIRRLIRRLLARTDCVVGRPRIAVGQRPAGFRALGRIPYDPCSRISRCARRFDVSGNDARHLAGSSIRPSTAHGVNESCRLQMGKEPHDRAAARPMQAPRCVHRLTARRRPPDGCRGAGLVVRGRRAAGAPSPMPDSSSSSLRLAVLEADCKAPRSSQPPTAALDAVRRDPASPPASPHAPTAVPRCH